MRTMPRVWARLVGPRRVIFRWGNPAGVSDARTGVVAIRCSAGGSLGAAASITSVSASFSSGVSPHSDGGRPAGQCSRVVTRLGQCSGMNPERQGHTLSVGGRRTHRGAATGDRIVLQTERLLLTPLTRLDETEHASASGRPADAQRDTGAAEVQWRECAFGPWAIRDLRDES